MSASHLPCPKCSSHHTYFLDASLNEVQDRIQELEASGGATVELSHKEIQDGLVQLRSFLTEMKAEE